MTVRISTSNPAEEVRVLLTRLNELVTLLPEPHKGVLDYAMRVVNNPSEDTKCCEIVGKLVKITAKLSQNVNREITLRGENGPLSWDTDLPAEKANPPSNPYEKTFLFQVLPSEMNTTLRFKFVVPPRTPNETPKWQRGDNCVVDLTKYGHHANITISGVTFADL